MTDFTIGPEKSDVYLLKKAPTEVEFKSEAPYSSAGSRTYLHFMKSAGLELEQIRMGYLVPEFIPKVAKKHIEGFREAVEKDIERCAPKVLIVSDHASLHWLVGEAGMKPTAWRGRFWPVRIRSHTCWALSTLNPAYIQQAFKEKSEKVKREYNRVTVNDLAKIEGLLELKPTIRDVKEDMFIAKHSCIFDAEDAVGTLDAISGGLVIATDIETNGFEPWNNEELVSFSVASEEGLFSIPLQHPEAQFTEQQVEDILQAYKRLLKRSKGIIAHNTVFETRWLCHRLGNDILDGPVWHDTLALAYLLDPRGGCLKLDYQALFMWGVLLKKLTTVDVANLMNEPLKEVLTYNGLDAYYTLDLFHELMEDIVAEDLVDVYEMHLDRTVSLTLMMQAGIPLDEELIADSMEEALEREEALLSKLQANKDVQEYADKRKVDFNPQSSPMVSAFFRGIYKSDDLINKKGKVSVDKEVLSRLKHPAAKLIEEIRSAHSEGVTLANWSAPELTDYRDKILHLHGHFSHTTAQTGRLSSHTPNLQNAKKSSDFRRIVRAPEGFTLVDVDYRQLEACGIAAVAEDEYFITALREGLDVHAECTRELQQIYPKFGKGVEFSTLRSIVKNAWVFPAFYGAGPFALSMYTGLPKNLAEEYYDAFWQKFRGVRQWQQRMLNFYRENGFIKGPTGRIYREPLSTNQILNYPIQGSCSDLLVESMGTLCSIGMVPRINIHDELLFCEPTEKTDTCVELIEDVLLHPSEKFDWLTSNVDLGCKIAVGQTWDNLGVVVDTTKG